MHGKLDLGKAKGLKQSEIKKLNRLLQQRIPKDKILTIELADSVAEISHETGYPLSLVVNRRGQVVNVTVGQPFEVNMPELKGVRVGPGRLCGHRIIHTYLQEKEKPCGDPPQKSNNAAVDGKEPVSKENLQCLARNRLDLLAQIGVNPSGTFSRSKGEQSKIADVVHIAHLLPGRDAEG
ncbi:MAG TPA: hypothetical protein PKC93_19130, partial [Candidatus Obscuribacter sp.]|nr:hypothetical protein [Candidatus Obscuribacter sp.]